MALRIRIQHREQTDNESLITQNLPGGRGRALLPPFQGWGFRLKDVGLRDSRARESDLRAAPRTLQGYLAHKKTPTPLGPP